MQTISGKIPSAKKVVVYGPEGIGKSTFASRFPNPIFIDVEGSTKHMDVTRTPKPTSFAMLKQQIQYFIANPTEFSTVVIDTADWTERMCIEEICARAQKTGIEDFGYGKGYVYVYEEIGKLLDLCSTLVERGVNVVFAAHAAIRKFEQPDELGSYDRWELKLGKKTGSQTAPLLKEWADLLIFVNYKTVVINVDDQGVRKGKNKVQGGKRVMYAAHHSCWDAKNRFGLPDEMPFDFAEIAHLFADVPQCEVVASETEPPVASTAPAPDTSIASSDERMRDEYDDIPTALRDLMLTNGVRPEEIQFAVARKGYFPNDMPINNYPIDFINGCLIGAWDAVYAMIKQNREDIPF